MTNKVVISSIVAAISIVGVLAFSMSFQESDEITYIPKNVLTLSTGEQSFQAAEASGTCDDSLQSVKEKASFPIKTPTVLPEGYSLRQIENVPSNLVSMRYADGPVCGENARELEDGVIEVFVRPMSVATSATNGKDFVEKRFEELSSNGVDAKIDKKGNLHLVGYPSGIGKSKIIEDGKTISEEEYDYAASVWVIDDNDDVGYRFVAYLPMDDLMQIAKSLR